MLLTCVLRVEAGVEVRLHGPVSPVLGALQLLDILDVLQQRVREHRHRVVLVLCNRRTDLK